MDWESALGELVTFVKGVAPDVWAIYAKQVTLDGIAFAAAALGFLMASIAFFNLSTKDIKDEYGNSNSGVFKMLGYAALVFVGGFAFAALNRFVNPDYFVIRGLLNLVK